MRVTMVGGTRRTRGTRRIPLLLLLLVPFAVQAALTAPANTHRVVLRRADRTLSATIAPGSLTGAHTRLTWDTSGVRGSLGGVPVDLRWQDDHIGGDVAGLPVNVQVSRSTQATVARGTIGRKPVDLELNAAVIRAEYRACSAVLELAGTEYKGFRRCASTEVPEKLAMQFPAEVAALDDTQQSALLLALLVSAAR